MMNRKKKVYLYSEMSFGHKIKILIHATARINLKTITLSERNQSYNIIFHLGEVSRIGKIYRNRK